MPIQANAPWWYQAFLWIFGGGSASPAFEIRWFPMNPTDEPTWRLLSDEELADEPPPMAPPGFKELVDRQREAASAASDFVDRLSEMLEADLTGEQRADLTRLLRRL
ncbi:hypothetical protein OG782_36775 [Streptomyces sp. NBC_00876]|uniref:hypothetical protein n=1 Tax=Streptomyces sp. NBC_00876 TaxID=2975853 RepID=UPI00386E5F46|nr:hypothetical protein OG782_36775 [Streptomyces sp. NBC_00876]